MLIVYSSEYGAYIFIVNKTLTSVDGRISALDKAVIAVN